MGPIVTSPTLFRNGSQLLCPRIDVVVVCCLQVDWLTEKMREANFTVTAMHGDMQQKERGAEHVNGYSHAVSKVAPVLGNGKGFRYM
jgi:hypothetical protein